MFQKLKQVLVCHSHFLLPSDMITKKGTTTLLFVLKRNLITIRKVITNLNFYI